MPIPTINTRPEKEIEGFTSKWNAAALPIVYSIDNTKFPSNTDDNTDNVGSITNDNGFAQLNLSTSNETYVAKEFIIISGFTDYQDGVYQIKAVAGSQLTLFVSYVSSDTGTIQRYYNNYTLLVRVYSGLPSGHPLEVNKPIELVTTLEQVPTTNTTKVDIKDAVLTKLSTENLIDNFTAVDYNLFTSFYIEIAERYDIVSNGEVVNFTSDFNSDISNILFANHGARQFQDPNGGNMYDNVSRSFGGNFLTQFEEPTLFENQYFDISILSDDVPGNVITVNEFDINNNMINSFEISLTYLNEDSGVYRFIFNSNQFLSNTVKFKLVIE